MNIYLSNLIVCVIASVICELIYITIILLIGNMLFQGLQMPMSQLLFSILVSILIIITYCSIYNFITMLCREISISTTICIFLFIGMFIVEGALSYIANSNKYITHSYSENGKQYIISQEPNPNYPGDEKVNLAKNICLLIPQGQANKLANNNTEDLYIMPIYSIALSGIINIIGIYLFSKKELK